MPIKPENKARYPANWKEIRERILRRALHCCEQCAAPNGTIIVRGIEKDAGTYMNDEGKVFDAENGEYLGQWRMSDYCCTGKGVRIVLTIDHLDHVPEHVDESNLKALCQRCHLAYDAEHHRINAAETRRSRKAIGDLFEVSNAE
jgi:5-methylcytosine-specific restriction endonuclease McrA